MPLSDFLNTVTPSYTAETLSITPSGQIVTLDCTGAMVQEIDELHGGHDARYDFGAGWFWVGMPLDFLSVADMATIWSLYLNPAKANGLARSFRWLHPTESGGNVYTVRFNTKAQYWADPVQNKGLRGVVLKVLGNYV